MSWIGILVLVVAIYAAIKVVGALFKIALWIAILGFAWWFFGQQLGIPFPFGPASGWRGSRGDVHEAIAVPAACPLAQAHWKL